VTRADVAVVKKRLTELGTEGFSLAHTLAERNPWVTDAETDARVDELIDVVCKRHPGESFAVRWFVEKVAVRELDHVLGIARA
jgi:hypothetical protein